MKRKVLSLLLVMVMGMSLLVGCGGHTDEDADAGNNTIVNQESDSGEKETEVDNTIEEQESDKDVTDANNSITYYTFSLCWDQELEQSAVVSYDPEKVRVIDLSYNAAKFQWLDRKNVELLLMCEADNSSVEDVYQKEMKSMEDDDFSVSELTEKKVGNCTVFRSDGVFDASGTVGFEFFATQLENGMVLYAVYSPGFENQVYLDEMLPYVLAYVATGDGAYLIPTDFGSPNEEDENTRPEGIEWDTYFEVTSIGGVKVKVYYDPDVIIDCYVSDMEFYLYDTQGNKYTFAIADFATAEERMMNITNYLLSEDNKYQNVPEDSEIMEGGAGNYPLKYYELCYEALSYGGEEWLPASYSEAIIELGAGIICVFDGEYFMNADTNLGEVLGAIQFIVEESERPSAEEKDEMVTYEWPDFLPKRPEAFEVLEVTIDQENNATHYSIDVGMVDYQTVKNYVDEIKNAGCDLENGHEKYSEEVGFIAFEGALDNHIITIYYDVEWNIFEIIIGEI